VTTETGQPVETVRVIVVAGIAAGALAGAGSRLAMLLLRLTSPPRVIGIRSDDDFVIGRFTLIGTYNLLAIGAAVGLIGAGVYVLVASRLLGPPSFRYFTVGLASAAVVGSMLVHSDGIDFTELKPTWLAIALFVALPGLFGTLIGPAVTYVRRPDSWTNRPRLRWAIPIVATISFPPTIPIVVLVIALVFLLTTANVDPRVSTLRANATFGGLVRVAWMSIAVAGLVALAIDIKQLT
jgi:hypothetical protein